MPILAMRRLNAVRRQVLAAYRGYPAADVFTGMPADVAWHHAALTPAELATVGSDVGRRCLAEHELRRPIAPDLAEVLNLDLPATVAYFTDEHVTSLGYDALHEAGLSNLSVVPVDEHRTLEHNGGAVEVLPGESMFTASLLLVLEHVLDRCGLMADPDLGAFVGVPNRHQLDFHAAAGARAIPGVVSPNVYWWRPSGLRRISPLTPDGPRIEVDTELQSVLEPLTRR